MKVIGSVDLLDIRFLDRLVTTLEEKKHHEAKLKEGLKDLYAKRLELQNSLSSSWPKQVSSSYRELSGMHTYTRNSVFYGLGGGRNSLACSIMLITKVECTIILACWRLTYYLLGKLDSYLNSVTSFVV